VDQITPQTDDLADEMFLFYLRENVHLCEIPAQAPAAETCKKCQFVSNDHVSFVHVRERHGSYSGLRKRRR